MFTDKEIGARVAQIRERTGWKQVALGVALGFKRRQTAHDIEVGRRKLRFSEAIELAAIFDVPLTELVPREEP